MITQNSKQTILLTVVLVVVVIIVGAMLRSGNTPPIVPMNQAVEPEQTGQIDRFSFFPNFFNITKIIHQNGMTMALAEGGVAIVKQDGEVTIVTPRDGFTQPYYRNLVYRNGFVWLSTNFGIGRYDVDSQEVKQYFAPGTDSLVHATHNFDRLTTDDSGLASNSNIKLFVDPYADKLWAATFDGVSEYNDLTDSWTTYRTWGKSFIHSVRSMEFTKNVIAVFGTPSGSFEGIGLLNKQTGERLLVSDVNNFPFSEIGDYSTHATDDQLFIYGRPKGYRSCGDQYTSKSSIIGVYNPESGWMYLPKLNDEIKLQESIAGIEFETPKLKLYLTGTCDNRSTGVREVEYDTQTDSVATSWHYTQKQFDALVFPGVERPIDPEERRQLVSQLQQQINPYASRTILFQQGDRFLTKLSFVEQDVDRTRYTYLKPDVSVDEQSSGVWKEIEKGQEAFLKSQSFQSGRTLEVLLCNQHNAIGSDVYFRLTDESGEMGGYGDNAIVKYDVEAKKFSLIYHGSTYDSPFNNKGIGFETFEPLTCFQDEFSYLKSNNEIVSVNFKNKTITPVDPDHAQQIINDPSIIGDVLYFISNERNLGMFDLHERQYSYVPLVNYENVDQSIANMQLQDIDGDTYYFTNKNTSSLRRHLTVYNAAAGTWDSVPVLEDDRNVIRSVKRIGDMIVMITDEGYDALVRIADPAKLVFDPIWVGGNILAINGEMYKTSNSLVINSQKGIWIVK